MATKKKTTKKPKVKLEEPKHYEPFDLSVETPEQGIEIAIHLQNMMNTQGWHIMKQVLEGNIAILEQAIVRKKDPDTGELLTDEEVEDVRKNHNIMEQMLNKPQELVERFKKQDSTLIPSYDPFDNGTEHVDYASSLKT